MDKKVKMTVSLDSVYKRVQFWNGIFNLTNMELQVLGLLISVQDPDEDDNICDVTSKKIVAHAVGIRDFNTLNNYIKKLKDKGALICKDRKYTLPRLLNPEVEEVIIKII